MDVGPPWPVGSSHQLMQAHWPACNSLPQNEGFLPSLWGTDTAVSLARYHLTQILKQNETGKKIPTQVPHKSSVGSENYLSFSKEVFQAQNPFLCDEEWVKGLHTRLSFPIWSTWLFPIPSSLFLSYLCFHDRKCLLWPTFTI